MKNVIKTIVLAMIVSFYACGQNNVEKTDVKTKDTTSTTEEHVSINAKDFMLNNPVLFGGCSFGNYFQALYKTGQFEEMLKYTSSESIKKFGKSKILNFYKNMEFGYLIKIKSINQSGNITTLNYNSSQFSTNRMFRINVLVENDTTKIVLKDLKAL